MPQEEIPNVTQRQVLIADFWQTAAPFHGDSLVSIFDLGPVFQLSKDLFVLSKVGSIISDPAANLLGISSELNPVEV